MFLRIQFAHWPVWKPTAITASLADDQRKTRYDSVRKLQLVLLSNWSSALNSHLLPLFLPWTQTMHLCSTGVYFQCVDYFTMSENQTFKVGPTCISQGAKRYLQNSPSKLWKCIESTNPCCPPVQHLRFMHFRNLHHCLFKCRSHWLDCLTFRTFLSCCAVKIFQPKNPEIPAFQKPSSPLFSNMQNSTEISIT